MTRKFIVSGLEFVIASPALWRRRGNLTRSVILNEVKDLRINSATDLIPRFFTSFRMTKNVRLLPAYRQAGAPLAMTMIVNPDNRKQ